MQWSFPCWYMLLKINNNHGVFLHKHVRSLSPNGTLNTGLSPGTNDSTICMQYSRGPHANQFYHQRSSLLCVTVQRKTAFSLECWVVQQKRLALVKHIKQHTTALHLHCIQIIVLRSLKLYIVSRIQREEEKAGWMIQIQIKKCLFIPEGQFSFWSEWGMTTKWEKNLKIRVLWEVLSYSAQSVRVKLVLFIQPGNERLHLPNTSLPQPSTSCGAYLFGQWWNSLVPSAPRPSSSFLTLSNVNHYNDDKKRGGGNKFSSPSLHFYNCFNENPSAKESKSYSMLFCS